MLVVKCQIRNKMPHNAKGESQPNCDRRRRQTRLNSHAAAILLLLPLTLLAVTHAARVDNAKLETQIKLLINDDELLMQQRKPPEANAAARARHAAAQANDETFNAAASDNAAADNDHERFHLYRSELKRLSYETIHRILRDENEPIYRRADAELRHYQQRSDPPAHEVVRRAAQQQQTRTLNLSHQQLRTYDATHDFHGDSGAITTLDLSHNQLRTLNVSAFKALQQLNAAENALTALPLDANSSLVSLNLNANRIKQATAPRNLKLHELHLSANAIEQLAQLNLSMLSALETLDLSCNRIEELETAFFPQRMHNLKHLNLAHNRLGTIYRETFYNLLSLNTLLLTHNNISDIDYETFLALPNLQYLDLSYNQLHGESIRALQGIPDLVRLSIAYNPEVGAAMQEFVASWSLKELDASGTGLCQIPAALAQSVRTLKLTDNWLKLINCGDLDSYPLLQYLDLSHSHIEDIEDDALGRLEILEVLFLDHNQLRKVPLSLPTSLEHLFLQHNEIMDIQAQHFQGLNHLQTLDLSGNKLLYLPALPLPKLLTLNLRGAGLKGVSQALVHTLPRLRDLLLEENPIKCSDLLSIAEWASPCRIVERNSYNGSSGSANAIDVAGDVVDDDDDVGDSEDNRIGNGDGNTEIIASVDNVGQQQQQFATTTEAAKIELKQKFVRMHNFFEKFKSNCGAQRQIVTKAAAVEAAALPPACAIELEPEDEAATAQTTTAAAAAVAADAIYNAIPDDTESNAKKQMQTLADVQQSDAAARANAAAKVYELNQKNFTAEMAAENAHATKAAADKDYRAKFSSVAKNGATTVAATTMATAATAAVTATTTPTAAATADAHEATAKALPPIRTTNKLAATKTLRQVSAESATTAEVDATTAEVDATTPTFATKPEVVATTAAAAAAATEPTTTAHYLITEQTDSSAATSAARTVAAAHAAANQDETKTTTTAMSRKKTPRSHQTFTHAAQKQLKNSGTSKRSQQRNIKATAAAQMPAASLNSEENMLQATITTTAPATAAPAATTTVTPTTTAASTTTPTATETTAAFTENFATIGKTTPTEIANAATHVPQLTSTLSQTKDNNNQFDTINQIATEATIKSSTAKTITSRNEKSTETPITAATLKTPTTITLLRMQPMVEDAPKITTTTAESTAATTKNDRTSYRTTAPMVMAMLMVTTAAPNAKQNDSNRSHNVQQYTTQQQRQQQWQQQHQQFVQWQPSQHNFKRANPNFNDISALVGQRTGAEPESDGTIAQTTIMSATTAAATTEHNKNLAAAHEQQLKSTTTTTTSVPATHRHEPLQLHIKDRHLIGTPLLMHRGQNVLVEAAEQLMAPGGAVPAKSTTTTMPAPPLRTTDMNALGSILVAAPTLANSQAAQQSNNSFGSDDAVKERQRQSTTSDSNAHSVGSSSNSSSSSDKQTAAEAINDQTKALSHNGIIDAANESPQLNNHEDKQMAQLTSTTTATATTTTTATVTLQPATMAHSNIKPDKVTTKAQHGNVDEAKKKPTLIMKKMTFTTKHATQQQQQQHFKLNTPRENEAMIERRRNDVEAIVLAKQMKSHQLAAKAQMHVPAMDAHASKLPHKHSTVNTPIIGGEQPQRPLEQQHPLTTADDDAAAAALPPQQATFKSKPQHYGWPEFTPAASLQQQQHAAATTSTNNNNNNNVQQHHAQSSNDVAPPSALAHEERVLKSEQWLDVRKTATHNAHPALVLLLSFALFVVLLVGLLHVYRCDMPWRRHFGAHQQHRPHHQRQLNEDDGHSFLSYAHGQAPHPRWHHSTRTQPPYSSPLHNLHVRELQKTVAVESARAAKRYYDMDVNGARAINTRAATATTLTPTANRSGSNSNCNSEASHTSSSLSSSHSSAILDADDAFYIEMTPDVAVAVSGSSGGGGGIGGCDMLPMELLSGVSATCKRRDQATFAGVVNVTGGRAKVAQYATATKTTTMAAELLLNGDGYGGSSGSAMGMANAAGVAASTSARRFDLW